MTTYWTYGDIRSKILADLDLEDELFVSPSELLGYVNEGIDEAESEIHALYEDYFLARAPLSLVSGQEGYALPANIYAMKVRSVMYQNGAQTFEVKRLRDWKKIQRYTDSLPYPTATACYEYLIENPTAGAPQFVLSPTPQESGPFLTVWYIRNANRLVNDSDVCDIPEFTTFVIQFAKVRCYEKEGHPNLSGAVAYLEQLRKNMNATLASLTADGDTTIEPDLSAYVDHE